MRTEVKKARGGLPLLWRLPSLLPLLLLPLLLGPVSGGPAGRRGLTTEDLEDIEEFIELTRRCYGVTGLTVSVVQGDEVLLAKGFGHVDVAKRENATANTPFCIGSLSKAFTSTLVALQLGENKTSINWDTPLHCYPDSDIAFTDDIRSSQASMRDLLAHKLGVPSYFGALLVGYPESTTRQEIAQRVRFMEPTQPFRASFIYNNYMYAVAGYAAELLAGRRAWEQLNSEKLFEPLGMTASGYIDQTPTPPGLALPYVYVNGSAFRVDTEVARSVFPLGPAGSVFSTAVDMAKWIQLHLAVMSRRDGGTSGADDVPFPGRFRPTDEAVSRIWDTYQAQMPEPDINFPLTRPQFPVVDVLLSYAMGWKRAIYRGYRKLFHTGGISTYISLLELFPDIQAGIFLSTSGPGGSNGGKANRMIASYIADKLLGETPWLTASTACSFPEPWASSSRQAQEEAGPLDDAPQEEGLEGTLGNVQGNSAATALPTLSPTPIPDDPKVDPAAAFCGQYGHMGFGSIEVYEEEKGSGKLFMKYGRFGRALLKPTSVLGFYYASWLDKLWFVSNQDGQRASLGVQFVNLEGSKAQELLTPIDPSTVSIFRRSLDVSVIPPHKRQDPSLYVCPNELANRAAVLTHHYTILIAIVTCLLLKPKFFL